MTQDDLRARAREKCLKILGHEDGLIVQMLELFATQYGAERFSAGQAAAHAILREAVSTAAYEWQQYVSADTAPCSNEAYIQRAFDEALEQLPAAPATDDWIAYSESPNVDGFYWCYTDCPPQSHPQQALRFKDRNWMTSWPVLYWSKLRPPPVSGAEGRKG